MPPPSSRSSSQKPDLAAPVRGGTKWLSLMKWLSFWNNILLIPLFTIMALEASTRSGSFATANLFLCASFLSEYFLGLALAGDRRAYLRDPARLTDFISSIPFGYFLQGLRVIRLFRLLRLARIMWRARRFRGKGAKLVRVIGMVGSLTFAGALALRVVEPTATNDLAGAIWWSVVTLSTVGYGDIIPSSAPGRIVGMVLIFAGIGVFGFMAGFVTSLMEDPEEDEILETVKRIEERLDRLVPPDDHSG